VDSPWHRAEINLLIESTNFHFRGRNDYYCGGDMLMYYSLEQARRRRFLGPDYFFVWGAELKRARRYWAVWDEGGKYPDMIVELLSQKTRRRDRGAKKQIYERTFRTAEYVLYDPDKEQLEGFRLMGRRYQPIRPDERGWLWSDQLELWLGTWAGAYQRKLTTWLRFYDTNGHLVLTPAEAERQRAERERQRADAAEAEVKRLKSRLTRRNGA
jgi:Uma2 family endonuclease